MTQLKTFNLLGVVITINITIITLVTINFIVNLIVVYNEVTYKGRCCWGFTLDSIIANKPFNYFVLLHVLRLILSRRKCARAVLCRIRVGLLFVVYNNFIKKSALPAAIIP
jgi:hypothetical protein